MAKGKTLLERLASPRDKGSRPGSGDGSEVMRSILRHLQSLLNCRTGEAPAQMDFGILDLSEVVHDSNDGLSRMRRSIKDCIEKYEPRLGGVEVVQLRDTRDPSSLRFEITASLTRSASGERVSFDTLVDSSGRIRIVKE